MKFLQDLVPGCNKVSSWASRNVNCHIRVSIGTHHFANLREFPILGGWQGTHAWRDHKLCAITSAASWGEDATHIVTFDAVSLELKILILFFSAYDFSSCPWSLRPWIHNLTSATFLHSYTKTWASELSRFWCSGSMNNLPLTCFFLG